MPAKKKAAAKKYRTNVTITDRDGDVLHEPGDVIPENIAKSLLRSGRAEEA